MLLNNHCATYFAILDASLIEVFVIITEKKPCHKQGI